jgi:hypothetical protein
MLPKQLFVSTILFVSLLLSCTKEDPIQKEERLLKERLEGSKYELYKTVKVALRCGKESTQNPELAEARKSIFDFGLGVLNKASSLSHGQLHDSTPKPNLLQLGTAAWKAKKILLAHDEDEFPTIMENIIWMAFNEEIKNDTIYSVINKIYNKDTEHVLFGAIWCLSMKLNDFALYELSRVDDEKLAFLEIKALSKPIKAFALYSAEYYWLAEREMDKYLYFLETNRQAIIENTILATISTDTQNPDAHYYELHGIGHLLRSLARMKIEEKEETAYQDQELFLADAEKAGIDNELTWMINVYLAIRHEDKEKAVLYLSKLENSTLLSESEKQSIVEIKDYVQTREKKGVFNFVKDKMAFVSISSKLVKKEVSESKYAKDFMETDLGKEFIKLKTQMETVFHAVDKTESTGDNSKADEGSSFSDIFD